LLRRHLPDQVETEQDGDEQGGVLVKSRLEHAGYPIWWVRTWDRAVAPTPSGVWG
jgi:hypothetical protein